MVAITSVCLTLQAQNKNCSRRHFNFFLLFFEENKAWLHYLSMSSAAVVIDALKVKTAKAQELIVLTLRILYLRITLMNRTALFSLIILC